jgi:hypothetical protein
MCFPHVKVPKKNVPIDVAPNVERENLGAKCDGNDIHLEIDKSNNTRSKIISHFIKGKISFDPMELFPLY